MPSWQIERVNPAGSAPTATFTTPSGSINVDPRNPDVAWQKLRAKKVDATVVKPNVGELECPPNHTRWVCISDTHGHIDIESIPDGDVLVHAGDLTDTGSLKQVREFCSWMERLPHQTKLVIAGNHDITLDTAYYGDSYKRFHYRGKEDDAAALAAMRENAAFTFLEDTSTVVHGYNVYGSPWQPEFCGWAFNLDRGEPCQRKWQQIPSETDVLITHGPPVGHGDLCNGGGNRAGCVDLLAEITNRVAPLYHVFGHVHEGYGQTFDGRTNFINASTCTFQYRPTQKPIVFDLPNK